MAKLPPEVAWQELLDLSSDDTSDSEDEKENKDEVTAMSAINKFGTKIPLLLQKQLDCFTNASRAQRVVQDATTVKAVLFARIVGPITCMMMVTGMMAEQYANIPCFGKF
ncbi:unnamed protein product [Cylindrotheca closterium]|uniref:Uncharacterized protein n=1 Tax=Cylindrotheca closterium TaxID=2856 RepID=A0AAD2GFA3_9STRA|nr:unnamed protein product [Cylindrotheca closterium]